MAWKNFTYKDNVYDLSHTNSFDHTFEVGIDGRERQFKCHVVFNHHVFTKERSEETPEELIYPVPGLVDRERREFCFERLDLSKQLPDLIRQFGDKRCFNTSQNNFLRLEVLNSDEEKEEYQVYFRMSKTGQKGWITMTIESAYPTHDTSDLKKKMKKWRNIRFALICLLYTSDAADE